MNLNLPYDLPDFVKVVNRIKESISKHEKVVVYGDYDVDGLTSTAIMVKTLLQLGLKSGYFIPSRYHEGYGLCISRVEDFIKKGYQTIITVDNGISAFEAIDYAKSKGLEVIVIDHHEIQEKLPNTDYIFHQNLSGFIDYNCSAASLAFFVCSYLLGGFDYYLATMAGIAVFSDVMPLIGNNLELAKISLFAMKKFRYPNLISLNTSDEISYDYYSFVLIPSLNSVGRILTDTLATNAACKFLIYPDQPD
ncbi:MAG: DHH family phosphoesterase, partial [Bacilli bacterium]